MSEQQAPQDEVTALTLVNTADIDEVPAALLAVYDGLDGDVVTVCEAARQAINHETLRNLARVRKALAPSGRFKQWCDAAGHNYGTVQNQLSAIESKQRINAELNARSVAEARATEAAKQEKAPQRKADREGKPPTPSQQRNQERAEARRAEREAAAAAERREGYLSEVESRLRGMLEYFIPSAERDIALLKDEQRKRYGAAAKHAAAVVKRLKAIADWTPVDAEVAS